MTEARLLAIETTGPAVSVAVAEGGTVLARADVLTRSASSELVMRLVDDLLRWTGTGADRLGRIAVSRGPGSFTGIRVGLATARALGLGWEREVVSVTAFEALVATARGHRGPVSVLLDARRGQIYGQAFVAEEETFRPVGDPQVVDPGDAGRVRGGGAGSEGGGSRRLVLGNAAARYPDAIARAFPGALVVFPAAPDAPGVVAAVAGGHAARTLTPLYVRPPDARLPGQRAPA